MATTRIMPLHIGKGRTESQAISDIIDYVTNPQKTDNGKLITGYGCDSRTADAEFLLAKRQYIAATGRVRGADDVIAYHVRQSFKPYSVQTGHFPFHEVDETSGSCYDDMYSGFQTFNLAFNG